MLNFTIKAPLCYCCCVEFPFQVFMSSSEKSEFLSLPMPASLVTRCVDAAAPLAPAPEDAEDPVSEEEDPKKLDIMDQRRVKGVRRSITRDIRPPSWRKSMTKLQFQS